MTAQAPSTVSADNLQVPGRRPAAHSWGKQTLPELMSAVHTLRCTILQHTCLLRFPVCLISGVSCPQGAPQHVCTQGGLEEPGELLPRVLAEGLCTLSSSHTQALWLREEPRQSVAKIGSGFGIRLLVTEHQLKLEPRLSPDNPLSRAVSRTGAISGSILWLSHSLYILVSSMLPPARLHHCFPLEIHLVHTKSTWFTPQIHLNVRFLLAC